jgi:Anthrone oxygenase
MTNAVLIKITGYVSLVGCCMLAGIAGTVLVLELALRRLNGQEYAHVRQVEFVFFTPFIGAVLLPTLIAVAMLVIHARKTRSPTLRPTAIALGLLLLAVLISLTVNGPINVGEQSWNLQALPAEWARIRDRWQIAHAVRTVAIVFALGYLCAAILDRAAPGMPDAIEDRDD